MRKTGLPTLVVFVVTATAALVGVLVAGWSPLLGLDLQGGVSVVLQPTEDTPEQDLDERVDQAIEIIRSRVDAVGVAEPDITRQGDTVLVQLPGVDDQQRVLDLVGTTAELRFRPVLNVFPNPDLVEDTAVTTTTEDVTEGGGSGGAGNDTTSTTVGSGDGDDTGEGAAAPAALGPGELALGRGELASSTEETAPDDSPQVEVDQDPAVIPPTWPDTTPAEEATREATVILPAYDDEDGERQEVFRYELGPTALTGEALSSAQSTVSPVGEPIVSVSFKGGDDNAGAWQRVTSDCFGQTAACPGGAVAIVLDGEVVSAPTVRDVQVTTSDEAVISGDFSRSEADDLATVLKFGQLPVEFEQQAVQEVSATVGEDALRAGVVAGVLGLLLVTVFILAYYRLLGIVAIASLTMSFALLWAAIAFLGERYGLALTLAGVVGIIVSVGVSVDSNIVYFENIKDDMRTGRNLRSSTERAFRGAMSTIWKADAVSLLAAGLLYWLTVGPVRGFAFFLGLATLLDLVASLFFMRPAVAVLARSRRVSQNLALVGMPQPPPGSPGGRRAVPEAAAASRGGAA